MAHFDARSAARTAPDQPLVDIADYVIDYQIDSVEAINTARYMLLDSLACSMLAMKFPECVKQPCSDRIIDCDARQSVVLRIDFRLTGDSARWPDDEGESHEM